MMRREMAVFSVDSLPLGFRFRPTDVELVNHYLKGKIRGRIKSEVEVIPVIDVCKCDPWDLPAKALIKSSDEWFFFSPKDRKYPNSGRSNRTTLTGYWKATGKDRMIKARARDTAIIGTKKTLVFYQGRAPKGVRTNWIVHEYRTTEPELDSGEQGGFVLYRLFKKMEEKVGEKTPVSEVDDCLERNIDDTHSSALSSSSTMLSPDGMRNGEDATGEPVMPLDQKPLLCDWQENIQLLPPRSDEQLSAAGELFAEKNNFTRNNLPMQEESHFTGAVESLIAGVDFSLDNLAQFDVREFEDGFRFDSFMLSQMEHEFYDGDEKFAAESNPCQNLEDYYVTEFLDGILRDPEECSPDVSNACSTLFPCYSYNPSEAFFIKDNTTGIGRDNTDVPEILEHNEENTESSLDSSINAKKDHSHGNAISTVETFSPLEFGDAEKSAGLRSRRAHKDEIEKKTSDQSLDAVAISSGSYSVIRIILILSALLFL